MHHPNIVQLYEVIVTESKIFMVMEYCSGGEAFEYLVRWCKEKRLPTEYTLNGEHHQHQPNEVENQKTNTKFIKKIFRQLVDAIGYCHSKNFVHRDLKLENILLTDEGDVKVIDFGFTREYSKNSLLSTYCGSVAYAAPEMIAGTKYSGPAVDIWSLGVILFTLVCGYLPFDDDNETVIQKKITSLEYVIPDSVDPVCRDLITKILQLDGSKRLSIQNILNHPWLQLSSQDDLSKSGSSTNSSEAKNVENMSPITSTSSIEPGSATTTSSTPAPAPIETAPETPTTPSSPAPPISPTHLTSADEIRLLSNLEALGFDSSTLIRSVQQRACDQSMAIWYLLIEKQKATSKHRNSTSSSPTIIHDPSARKRTSFFGVPSPLYTETSPIARHHRQPHSAGNSLSGSPNNKTSFVDDFTKLQLGYPPGPSSNTNTHISSDETHHHHPAGSGVQQRTSSITVMSSSFVETTTSISSTSTSTILQLQTIQDNNFFNKDIVSVPVSPILRDESSMMMQRPWSAPTSPIDLARRSSGTRNVIADMIDRRKSKVIVEEEEEEDGDGKVEHSIIKE